MSGSSIPYHLRTHKSVDRRLFLDLLGRFERWRPLQDYCYLSMGAYPLEDHKAVHRQFGISRLIAFDYDEAVVERQIFNKPVSTCDCLTRTSGQVIDSLDKLLDPESSGQDRGMIIWLDYTDPKELGTQIREVQTLLDKAAANDLVRITVNASSSALATTDVVTSPIFGGHGKPRQEAAVREAKLKILRSRIGEFLPADTSPDDVGSKRLPILIARAFETAAGKAFPANCSLEFVPLSIVTYADGQQMLSITGVVARRGESGEICKQMGLASWPFAADGWKIVHTLEVPDLTLRERMFIDRAVMAERPEQIVEGLGFDKLGGRKAVDFVNSYRQFYRFFPSLLVAEA